MVSHEKNYIKLQQQSKDLTKCCVCTETFTDPRILSCTHTFCRKCLEDAGSESNKKSGQNNISCPLCKAEFSIPLEGFNGIQKNFFLARLIETNRSSSSNFCDACLEDFNDPVSAIQVPLAEMFCTVCYMKLCEMCVKIHRKSKRTTSHRLETADDQGKLGQNQSRLIPEFCKEHESERLQIYCSDCKEIICSLCYIEGHQGHKWSDIEKASDEFCRKIRDQVQNLALKNYKLVKKKEKVKKAELDIVNKMESLERDINQRKTLLKEAIDKHADLLLMEVETLRQEKLKLVETDEGDIDMQIANEEYFSLYCQEIAANGSAGEICRDEAQLNKRAIELQEMNDSLCQRHLESAHGVLQMSELDAFLKENGTNFLGTLTVSSRPTELPEFITINEVSFAQTDTSEEGSLERPPGACLTTREDGTGGSHPGFPVRTSGPPLDLQLTGGALKPSNPSETIEVLAKFENLTAASVGTQVDAALVKSQRITGMAVVDNELFITTEKCSTIEVYDCLKFNRLRSWSLPGLTTPEDMVASLKLKCLYIFDAVDRGNIYQVGIHGSRMAVWFSGNTRVRLSAESSCIVVTYLGEKKLRLYRYDKSDRVLRFESELVLQAKSTHAVKLKTGNIVVSRGKGIDRSTLIEIDTLGKEINSFKGKPGTEFESLNCPEQLSVGQDGSVFVIDRGNRRVLLLNSNLEIQRELISWKSGLKDPIAIALDDEASRLYITDHDSADNLWRILVIDIA